MKIITKIALFIIAVAFIPMTVSAEDLFEKHLKAWSLFFVELEIIHPITVDKLGESKLEVDVSDTQLVKYDVKITGYNHKTKVNDLEFLSREGITTNQTFSLDMEPTGSDGSCRLIDGYGECDYVTVEVMVYKTKSKVTKNCRAKIKITTE